MKSGWTSGIKTLCASDLASAHRVVVSTLQGGGKRGYRVDAESAAGGHLIPVDFRQITSPHNGASPKPGDPCPTLGTDSRICVTGNVTHALTSEGADASEDGSGRRAPIVNQFRGVRRLMPVECERLQGFPDGWTEWHGYTGKKQSDSARYRQLGNAVAVPVIQWVMDRIVAADAIDEREAA